jgi:hypothetical protein
MAMSTSFQLRSMPDAHTAAHLVGEMAAWSAWHRRHGPDGKLFDDQTARRTTIECAALTPNHSVRSARRQGKDDAP